MSHFVFAMFTIDVQCAGIFIIIYWVTKLRFRWCVMHCLVALVHPDFQSSMHLKYVVIILFSFLIVDAVLLSPLCYNFLIKYRLVVCSSSMYLELWENNIFLKRGLGGGINIFLPCTWMFEIDEETEF